MLLDRLRQHTRAHHERIEQLNGLPETLADYLAQHETFYGFIAPWEELVASVLPADDPVRRGREKTAWLESDLAYFGHDAATLADLPRCALLPSARSRAEILGAAYVLEGATLGGQIVARDAGKRFGLSGGRGCRYFESYGREVGAQWQAFRAELLRHSSAANDALILEAATNTFDCLHAWFAARKAVLA